MTLITGKHISLTSKDVLAVFPPRALATGLPNDAPHVISNPKAIDILYFIECNN